MCSSDLPVYQVIDFFYREISVLQLPIFWGTQIIDFAIASQNQKVDVDSHLTISEKISESGDLTTYLCVPKIKDTISKISHVVHQYNVGAWMHNHAC